MWTRRTGRFPAGGARRAGAVWVLALRRLWRSGPFRSGLALLLVILVMAAFAEWLAPHPPTKNNFRARLKAPSAEHPMGTDAYGRDVLSRVIHGTRVSLGVGATVVLFTGVLGTLIGALSGYFRRLDNVIMRCMDGLMAFPGILLAIALATILGPSMLNAAIALSIVYTPRTARVVRASFLVVREMDYVQAAIALGAPQPRIIFRHILLNSLAPLIVQLTFVFAVAVLSEAVLSFLGVGPPPPTPSLGNVIAEGRKFIPTAPWISLFPGVAIAITVLGLNLMGDGLRDVLDPRLKET